MKYRVFLIKKEVIDADKCRLLTDDEFKQVARMNFSLTRFEREYNFESPLKGKYFIRFIKVANA